MITLKEFEAPIEWAFEKNNFIYKSISKGKLYTDSKKLKKNILNLHLLLFIQKTHH